MRWSPVAFFALFVPFVGCSQSHSGSSSPAPGASRQGVVAGKLSAAGDAQPGAPRAPVRVVVVGGGLAGLVAAYQLDKGGISTHVLEADSVWGGRVGTAQYEDGINTE